MMAILAYAGRPFFLAGTLIIILLVYFPKFLPYGSRLTISGFRQIDKDLEDSARVCGFSELVANRQITLPLMKGVIFASFVSVFLSVMREYPAAMLLTTTVTQTVPVMLYNYYANSRYSETGTIGLFMIVFSLAIIVIIRKALGLSMRDLVTAET